MKKAIKAMAAVAVIVLASMGFALSLQAVEVTSGQAQIAARNWVKRSPARMGATFKSLNAEPAETSRDCHGRAIYHVVNFDGGGFVVTAGDTRLTPVVAFSAEGRFVADEANPLYVLLQGDQSAAVSVVNECEPQKASSVIGNGGAKVSSLVESRGARAFAAAESEWRSLLAEDTLNGVPIARSSEQNVSDVRVDKLVQSHWDQSTWGNDWDQPNVYNYYTPNNYVCGCVATTGAQIMHYWRYPSSSVAMFSNECMVDGVGETMSSIAGAFDWDNMPLYHVTTPTITLVQQQAIGKLTYNVGVAVGMNWKASGSSASQSSLVSALKGRFGYQSGVFVYYNLSVGGSAGLGSFRNALYSNLDAGMPVTVSISNYGASGSGHSVIADGYGYTSGTLYTHINMGWSGYSEAWYNLINEEIYAADDNKTFTTVDGIGFNIHPTKTGDVMSGRVLTTSGRPVSGAEVYLYDASETIVAATKSNSKGIYSFRIASVGKYSIIAEKRMDTSDPVYYTNTGLSSSGTYGYDGGTGNKWGVDITLATADAGDEWDPVDDTADGGTLLNPTAAEQTHGAHTVSTTDLYDFFRVSMTSGKKYSFQATSSDMELDLYTSSDLSERVAHAANGAKIEYTPADSGMHYLRVRRFASASATYSLKYSYASNQATYLKVEGYYPDVYCTLSSNAVNFASKVDCDGEWTVSVDDTSWGVNLTTTSGSGNGYFYFSVPKNNGYNRKCIFTVTAGSLTARKHLTQYGPLGEKTTDAWDPGDNTPAGATLLSPDAAVKTHGPHILSATDNYDYFRISMTAGCKYVFETTGSSDMCGELFDSSMECVAENDDISSDNYNFRIEYTPASSGTYYLRARVYNNGAGEYSLKYSSNSPTVKVTLGKNGGTGGDNYITATYGKPMPTPRAAPTKAGYVFDGYWTTTGSGGVCYYDGAMKSVRNWDKKTATTLWAKWRKAAVVKVTFGKNGGTGGDSYVTCTEGKPMPTPRTAPTLAGWTFAGYWDTLATDANGSPTGKQYYDASMKSVRAWDKTSATTLWARWTNKVTFGKNGGSGGDNYVTCTKGQPMPKRTMPTKSGYFFDGYWNTTGAGGVKYYNSDGTSAHAWDRSGNVTLWAKWVKPVACKVTFGKNGGTGGDSYVTATAGKPMPTPRTAPKLSGWTFAGYWDTLAQDANGNPLGKQYYDSNMKSVRNWDKTTDATLWAKWTVKVTLGKNGGSGGDSVVTVTKGQSFPKRTMPTRSGYKFGGYFVSASKKTGQCYNTDGTGTSSMKWSTGGTPTIWALWTKAAGCVELPPAVAIRAASAAPSASAAPAVPEPDELPAGLYSGVLADGTGSFWLILDEPEEGCDRTAYLYVVSKDGALTAECAAQETGGAVVLTADDGSLFIVDLDAGIAFSP